MTASRPRSWWLWPLAALVGVVLVGAASQYRRGFVAYYEWRLAGKPENPEEWAAAIRGVLRWGNEAALERLARSLSAQRTPHALIGLTYVAEDEDNEPAAALVRHLLSVAARAGEAGERGNSLCLL